MKAISLAVLFLTTLCGLAVSKPSYGNDIFTLTLFGDKHPDVDVRSSMYELYMHTVAVFLDACVQLSFCVDSVNLLHA